MYLHGNNAQHKTSFVRNYSEWFNTLFLSLMVRLLSPPYKGLTNSDCIATLHVNSSRDKRELRILYSKNALNSLILWP